jgi:hypothetical protein
MVEQQHPHWAYFIHPFLNDSQTSSKNPRTFSKAREGMSITTCFAEQKWPPEIFNPYYPANHTLLKSRTDSSIANQHSGCFPLS